MVWALPRSLAATEGILSVPRGTEMFQFPRFPSCKQDDGVSPPPGCPIRTSLDRRLPAPPQGISSRGHVLPRQPAPRHPPCAHHSGMRVTTHPVPRSHQGCRTHPQWLSRFLRMGWPPCLFSCQGAAGSGAAGARTPNLRRARAALSQLSYDPLTRVGAPGLEPGTSALSGPRSNQLSYAPRPVRFPPTMEKPLITRVWRTSQHTPRTTGVPADPCHSRCQKEESGTGALPVRFVMCCLTWDAVRE